MNLEGMSLKKKFWRFVWPSVVAQWIFALYTMVDGMFVARGVSEVALSAVNIASPFVNFLFLFPYYLPWARPPWWPFSWGRAGSGRLIRPTLRIWW